MAFIFSDTKPGILIVYLDQNDVVKQMLLLSKVVCSNKKPVLYFIRSRDEKHPKPILLSIYQYEIQRKDLLSLLGDFDDEESPAARHNHYEAMEESAFWASVRVKHTLSWNRSS